MDRRRHTKQETTVGTDRELTIIIPVFNEQSRVRRCLNRLMDVFAHDFSTTQVIIVDDGSKDGTVEVVEELLANLDCTEIGMDIQFLQHPVNRGKGAAIRTGLEHATAPLVVIQDADLEYDPVDLGRLLARQKDDDADVVYGSRCLPDSQNPRRLNAFAWGVSLLNLVVRVLYRVRLTDEATCYKLFETEHLRRMGLRCERFEFCPEVTAKAIRMGLRIVEVPISYCPRSRDDGKKIGLRDGWEAVKTLWRYRAWRPNASVRPAAGYGPVEEGCVDEGRAANSRQRRGHDGNFFRNVEEGVS